MTKAADIASEIVITSAQTKLRRVKLDPQFLLAHEVMLQRTNALMRSTELNLNKMTVPQGRSYYFRDAGFSRHHSQENSCWILGFHSCGRAFRTKTLQV